MKKQYAFLAVALLAQACGPIPPEEAYYNRGTPESLLDVSSEVVNVALESRSSVQEVADWVNQDQPTRAEVYCMEGDPLCDEAMDVLGQFGVPVSYVASADNAISLVYERILAHDCENRYVNNNGAHDANYYNLNHSSFGCSVASNMVQAVSDRQQFVSPVLLGYQDGEKAAQTYRRYLQPPLQNEAKTEDSLLNKVQGAQGGGG